ncbi:Pyoverdine/dityrosine biosynthesis protein-domain-containing protein [Bipolaris maydis]|nr:Pyoverdine/dityrosine biosynthesis protein-domain-containing protein [Bipolaris maydis]KAJ6192999.1 Pyoverdine/dityrosine biosynthesis protein-domain-containing protein [Bipolaris maydis]
MSSAITQTSVDAKAEEILKIIEQYGLNYERTGKWEGFETFLPIVKGQVERKEPVLMLLPGFPFKSPNTKDKVLGVLPDLGEELALKHLDGLCEKIKAVYEFGAGCHITSDGLVYNDLLGVSDETVWNFGQSVRQIAADNNLNNISFLRLWDILRYSGDFQSKEYYLKNASNIRKELKRQYGDPKFEADMANTSTSDMQMTHTKYLEFLKQDLALNERHIALSPEDQAADIANTAKEMMGRWKAFSAAMAAVPTQYVRLSIHDSGGKDKLSMAVIPQQEKGALGATPWHSTLVIEKDGSMRTVQRCKVDETKYSLVYHNGRPYCFRAVAGNGQDSNQSFAELYPSGLTIRDRRAVSDDQRKGSDGGIDSPDNASLTATTTNEQCDWTAALPQTPHIRFFRNTDWSRTRLGPLDSWSPTLRLFASYVLTDSRAACLWWGDISHLTAIYNDKYVPLAANVHPGLMGSLFQEGYPELWPSVSAYFEQAKSTGIGVNYSSAHSTFVDRKGYREEAFFSGGFTPVGMPGAVEGYINHVYEVTTEILTERRIKCLNKLASVPPRSIDNICSHILNTLETNTYDVPMVMLYRMEETAVSNSLRLHGHIGLPEGHPLLVNTATIDSEEGLIPDMRRAGTDQSIIDYDDRFSSLDWKGWGAPSKKIVVMPIMCGGRLFGYLIFGTNPYRPHDKMCEQFIRDLNRMVSSLMTAAVDYESNKKHQVQLEADLAFSDLKLRHLIDHASVGMCHVSLDGYMLWANDYYYELAGQSPTKHSDSLALFFDAYHEDDRAKSEEIWERLLKGDDQVTVDLRLKRLYTPPTGDPEPAQLQVLAFPYRNEHGSVVSVMACTTDISRLCWAKSFQARQAAEAREAKRQQEAFIDVVSHEMRNPLSAIVHCADAITTALEECRAQISDIPKPCLDILNDNMHSANTIMQCAHHQKRIIDDVLTLSKLDSMLLSITPVPVKPMKLVDSIVNIFQAELKTSNIAYSITPDPSFSELGIDHLCFDPSRVTQIFINLLTNAIKFVKPSKEPAISIRYAASRSDPRTLFPSDMFWATDGETPADVTSNPDWGNGEEIYLGFSVTDSGIGLQEKDIDKIFQRFRQANVKTHVNYGGSGLGLFISKELTEKQGGEIGVASVLGEGSTFGFYVKTRRVEPQPKTLKEMFQQVGNTEFASRQLRVLLVEDNLINQRVLGKQLKKAGCDVTVANHGLEALDSLDRQTFDIVLMDLEMPVLDGLEAMRQFRKKELNECRPVRLPIIAVTANVRKEQMDTAMAAGADCVMQKPFKAADLVFMMKSLIPQLAPLSIDPPTPGLGSRSSALVP